MKKIMTGVALIATVTCTGCSWFATHPAVAPDLAATVQCVEAELVKDTAADDTPVTIGIDLGVTCGPLAAQALAAALTSVAPTASPTSRAHVLLAAAKK